MIDYISDGISVIISIISIVMLCKSNSVLFKINTLKDYIQLVRSKDEIKKLLDDCITLNTLINLELNLKESNSTERICEICKKIKAQFNELQSHSKEINYDLICDMKKINADLTEVIAGEKKLASFIITRIERCANDILKTYVSKCIEKSNILSK